MKSLLRMRLRFMCNIVLFRVVMFSDVFSIDKKHATWIIITLFNEKKKMKCIEITLLLYKRGSAAALGCLFPVRPLDVSIDQCILNGFHVSLSL